MLHNQTNDKNIVFVAKLQSHFSDLSDRKQSFLISLNLKSKSNPIHPKQNIFPIANI